ncbi:MAG: hypothetical protein A2Z83_06145 [Omnitrophica bacterium GWA2_52_8]|nr:MAG: hypothetical protein A2Z83_06145 [Omnitrophica bacterium GWA2_52_8]
MLWMRRYFNLSRRFKRAPLNQKGFALVWTAIFLVAALSLAAMAIDISYAYVVANELQSVADSGALQAAKSFVTSLRDQMADGTNSSVDVNQIKSEVQTTVTDMISRSKVLKKTTDFTYEFELEYGAYDIQSNTAYDGSQFTPMTPDSSNINEISAFRIHLWRKDTRSGQQAPARSVGTLFGKMMGINYLKLEREAVSILAPRNFVHILDTSGSMDDQTYPPPAGGLGTNYPWPANQSFITYPPRSSVADSPHFSPYAPGPASRFPGFETPRDVQPMQNVLQTTSDFLLTLSEHGLAGDRASIHYFSESAVEKMGLTDIQLPEFDTDVSGLLSNDTLYSNLVQGPLGGVNSQPHYILPASVAVMNFTTKQYDGPIAIPYGGTNIGMAIDTAVNTIVDDPGEYSVSVIILFTDGKPTCAPKFSYEFPNLPADSVICFPDPVDASQELRARNYTFLRAKKAISEGILIYPISYGDINNNTRVLFDEIAYMSGLKEGHFHIDSTDDVGETLQKIYDEIADFIPFILVGQTPYGQPSNN